MRREWPRKALGEACLIKPQKAEVHEKLSPTDSVSFLPMEDLGIDRKYAVPVQTKPLAEVIGSYTYFAEGDVLLAKITPCFENGKLGIASRLKNAVGFGSSEYLVFRANEFLNNEWLYYYLSQESFRTQGAERMSGAVGHKRVAKEFIEGCRIPVPPLPEQQRIVRILDEAFAGLTTTKANAEKNLQNARALFESYLHLVFTVRSTGWIEERLDDICVIGDGNHSSNYPRKEELVPEGIPFIRATNLVDGSISGKDMRFLSLEKHAQLKKGHLKTGDILITNRGEIGKTAIVGSDFDNANLNSQIAWLRCREKISNRYLFHFLNSGEMRAHFQASNNGAALQQFTIKQLKDLVIPYPAQKEQQRIVSRIDALGKETRHLESIYQQKLSALEELKKSLLHQAFSGQL